MFEEEDLVFDQRTLEGLGNLYNSLVCPISIWTRVNRSNGLLRI